MAHTDALERSTSGDNQMPDHGNKIIDALIAGYKQQPRSPILKDPSSQGLEFEEVSFPSEDGTPLEAWFMPKAGSDKLVIVNHPRYFNRYGYPSHLDPWKQSFAIGGNTIEVDFNPDFRILHDAGYNVLTYDLRNLGHSGTGQWRHLERRYLRIARRGRFDRLCPVKVRPEADAHRLV